MTELLFIVTLLMVGGGAHIVPFHTVPVMQFPAIPALLKTVLPSRSSNAVDGFVTNTSNGVSSFAGVTARREVFVFVSINKGLCA